MEKKVETTEINIKEFYGDNCLDDKMGIAGDTSERRPKGIVQIFEDVDGMRKLVHKSNLVLYCGREMLAQRLVNVDNPNVTSTKDEFLYWFGLGDGGTSPADPLDPNPPIITDTDLYSPIMISDTTSASYADPHIMGTTRPSDGYIYPNTGFYKKRFDQEVTSAVTFETDALNDDKYLVVSISITIDVEDGNGQQLSEAGLFSAESSVGGYAGNFTLFARVTFPTLIKTSQRRLIFLWYLYL